MKLLLLLLVAATLTASTACHEIAGSVQGSGNRVVQSREIGDFRALSTEGAFQIRVVCQKSPDLQIEGDDNILPLISTEISNGTLRLRSLRGYSVREPIEVRISVQNLESLSVSGAGRIDIEALNNERFAIDSTGAPTIRAAGITKVVDINAYGATKIDTQRLEASRAVVESSGVSKIDLEVKDELEVNISGPSTVTYEGDPVVKKSVNGPGKLEKKVSEGT